MDRRRTANLDGKCGSCRFFTIEQGRECTGYCSGCMSGKGRLNRSYKCKGYEKAPTVIPASEEGRVMELKPCPFCGSKAILRKVATGRSRSGYEYYIRCGNINCPVYVHTCNRDTEDEAAEIWNRRAE